MLANFAQVSQLLFAHGYHSQIQINRLICFYFYKNVVLVGSEVAFQCLSGFSRERFFITILISLYNLVLSTLQSMAAIMLEHRHFKASLQQVSS